MRAGTPASRRLQAGVLAGLDLQLVDLQTETWILPTYRDGLEPFEQVSEARSLRTLLAVGVDAGVRIDDRWTIAAFGIAGLPPAFDDRHRPQLRAGVIAKRDF